MAHRLGLLGAIKGGGGGQQLLHPVMERFGRQWLLPHPVFAGIALFWGQLPPNQGDGFGRVANLGVAVVEQPLREERALQADLAQAPAGDQAFALLAQQHMQGPGGVLWGAGFEKSQQVCHAGPAAAAGVEAAVKGGETAHRLGRAELQGPGR